MLVKDSNKSFEIYRRDGLACSRLMDESQKIV